MKPSQGEQKATTLFVAGDNTFNNDVLSNFLEAQTGLPCHCVKYCELPELLQDNATEKAFLLFLDYSTMDSGCLDMYAPAVEDSNRADLRCKVIWFNVDPRAHLEYAALKQGIYGILYDHQPVDLYARAVRAVLNGELFYPRRILEMQIMADDPPVTLPTAKKAILTRREWEILEILALGIPNSEIAAKLCLSPHTVKTHIYNLYKKINVSSRYQAVQWLRDQQQ